MGRSSLTADEKKTIHGESVIHPNSGEAEVYINELCTHVCVMVAEDNPAVLSLGQFRDDVGHGYTWTPRKSPRWCRSAATIESCSKDYVPLVAVTKVAGAPALVTEVLPASGPKKQRRPNVCAPNSKPNVCTHVPLDPEL